MIAYPVSWPQHPQAHVTLQYFGQGLADFPFGPIDVLGAMATLDWPEQITVETTGIEFFGEQQEFRVLTLDPDKLLFWQKALKMVLDAHGIKQQNGTEFPEYRPHITLNGLVDSEQYPQEVILYRPALWWGGTRY